MIRERTATFSDQHSQARASFFCQNPIYEKKQVESANIGIDVVAYCWLY